MDSELKFITDASLVRLAKWLRLLGYDTAVYLSTAGRQMLRKAEAEQRIVLTRRQDMLERQFSGMVFLTDQTSVGGQLREVIKRFSLKITQQNMFRICLVCNEKLCPVSKEEVQDLVPPFVFQNFSEYNKCQLCGKIYWAGTHGRNAKQFLDKNNINTKLLSIIKI
jgi:uncharacterized protein